MAGGGIRSSWRPWCLLMILSLFSSQLALSAPSGVDSHLPDASVEGSALAASSSEVSNTAEEGAKDKSGRNTETNELVLHNPSTSVLDAYAAILGYPQIAEYIRDFFSAFNTMDNESLLNENLIPSSVLEWLRYVRHRLAYPCDLQPEVSY